MNVLDSLYSTPVIDTLVIDHVAFFGLLNSVNNLWTWLAVVTAAVSLWRLRSSSSSPPSTPRHPSVQQTPPPRDTLSPSVEFNFVTEQKSKTTAVSRRNVVAESWNPIACGYSDCDGVTKRKFHVAYYDEEEETEIERVDDDSSSSSNECDGEVMTEWWRCWEEVLKMRTGELGWYTCQDLTAINGNVVRLWDDVSRRRNATNNYNGGVVECTYTSP